MIELFALLIIFAKFIEVVYFVDIKIDDQQV